MTTAQSLIIYDGPSLHDGITPIVVIAVRSSRNTKTGDMVQTYIMLRDVDPREANKFGLDEAICGFCPHKGKAFDRDDPAGVLRKLAEGRTCYVNIAQGVLIVWRHFQKGGYSYAKDNAEITALAAGAMVRKGTYGDPAMVPSSVWEALLGEAKGHTGYSHQADNPNADFRPDLTMVSVETEMQAWQHWAKGHRTFRMLAEHEQPVAGQEILCPSPKVKCTDCGCVPACDPAPSPSPSLPTARAKATSIGVRLRPDTLVSHFLLTWIIQATRVIHVNSNRHRESLHHGQAHYTSDS